jgi:NADH-quinone oxidoreductase subunit E
VTPEICADLAELLEVRPIEVLEVVSFYNMIDASPRGRHRVRVCTNLPCSLAGARSLLRDVESHLGLSCGETSEDGRITLGREECLGACAGAPMLWIDDAYHEGVDLEQARELLDALE